MPSLHLDYRPKTLVDFIGNKDMIASLKSIVERDKDLLPHAWLFYGNKGCGKTTLARIISQNYLGCPIENNPDYKEINCGSNGKIETVRDIEKDSLYKPLQSDNRVWVLDECFVAGTKIKTPDGDFNIEDVNPGDKIYSLVGNDIVIAKSKNKINLDRLIKLQFSNGNILYTTKDHLFFTNDGWIEAQNLTFNHLTFSYDMINICLDNNKEKNLSNERNKILCSMRQDYSEMEQVLWQRMRESKSNQRKAILFDLWQTCKKTWWKILWKNLLERVFKDTSGISTRDAFRGINQEKKQINKEIMGQSISRRNQKTRQASFQKIENEQSYAQAKKYRQNDGDKKNKWNLEYLAWRAWRKWQIYTTANTFSEFAWLANGISNISWKENSKLSNMLQGGFRQSEFESGNRNRWDGPQFDSRKKERSEKRKQINGIRLESSEIYQQGNNDESFKGIIGDKERNQGFVICYDLQVKNHPSYFANGFAVHNCHMLGAGGASEKNPAQNALLKILEDTPKRVHIILCTTDPQRLIQTIHSRCHSFRVSTLNDSEMKTLINNVLKKEQIDFPAKAIDAVIEASGGHPRDALKILDQVIDLEESAIIGAIQSYESVGTEVKELIDCLLKKQSWSRTSEIINKLKKNGEEPEKVRRAIIGYISAIMLNNKPSKRKGEEDILIRCLDLYELFKSPVYNNGWVDIAALSLQAVIV